MHSTEVEVVNERPQLDALDREVVDLTIVVPTFKEAPGIEAFLGDLTGSLRQLGRTFEVIVVDDSSPDGTADVAARALAPEEGHVLRRTGPASLSHSVIDGFRRGRGRVLGVMDADGSHPPAVIERLLAQIDAGADVAWGSRTATTGSAESMSLFRLAASRFASALVASLTPVSDPTSGLFLLRREVIDNVHLDPVGWKIGLEVLCRGKVARVAEVPFTFEERRAGQSKFGVGATLAYLQHLLRLRKDLPPPPDEVKPARSLRRDLLVTLVVCAAAFFPFLGVMPLTDPDEGLHALVARDMLARGDYLVPRLDDAPFLDKPTMFFALTALSFATLGEGEVAARLPSVIFSIGSVLVTLLVGRRLFGGRAGVYAAAVLATSVLPLALARAVAPDTALAFFTTAAIGAFAVGFATRPVGRVALALGYLATGGAFLAKGAPGLVVPAVALVAGLCLVGTHARLREARLGLGLLVVASVGLPWTLLTESASPGFARYFFYERAVLGFVSDTQRHGGEPLWYYVPVVLGGLFPWVVFLPSALRWSTRRAFSRHWPDGLALGAAASIFVLFSLAGSKLPTYVLPAFPLLALLIGANLDRVTPRAPSVLLGPVFLAGTVAAVAAGVFKWGLSLAELLPVALAGLTAAGALTVAVRRGLDVVWVLTASTLLVVWVTLGSLGEKVADQHYSARRLAEVVTRTVPREVAVFTIRRPSRSFEFYSRRKLVWLFQGNLHRLLQEPAPMVLAVKKRGALEQVQGHLAAAQVEELGDGGTHVLYKKEASATETQSTD